MGKEHQPEDKAHKRTNADVPKSVVVPGFAQEFTKVIKVPPDSGKDPLRLLVEIVENKNITSEDKQALIMYSQKRFDNRRKIAYIALFSILVSIVVLFIGAFLDSKECGGITGPCGVIGIISENASIFYVLNGFLTAIVVAYFIITAWRPSS